MIVINTIGMTWKHAVVVYFEVLSQHMKCEEKSCKNYRNTGIHQIIESGTF